MKPILMLGTAAYSPFRLDAIRAALGAVVASLSRAEIDARWVYAIQADGDAVPDADTQERAALPLPATSILCRSAAWLQRLLLSENPDLLHW